MTYLSIKVGEILSDRMSDVKHKTIKIQGNVEGGQ